MGAGVGALGSALTGRNPFQGALLGGATGGLMGGSGSLLGQTELGKSIFGTGVIPTATGNIPLSAAQNMLAPTTQLTENLGMARTLADQSMLNAAQPAIGAVGATGEMGGANLLGAGIANKVPAVTDTLANAAIQPTVTPSMFTSPFQGGIGNMITDEQWQAVAAEASKDPDTWSKFQKFAKENLTPNNMLGVASLVKNYSPQQTAPRSTGGGASVGVSRGQAPQIPTFNVGSVVQRKKIGQI